MTLPRPPHNLQKLEDAVATIALQQWLWACLAAGWNPVDPDSQALGWSHDDNMEATHLGWMIAQPPGNNIQHLDLFSLKRGVPAYEIMDRIIAGAVINPLCAKAVSVLTAQKLKFPGRRFAFERSA